MEMTGVCENEEDQTPYSLLNFPRPLEIAARFPTFPPPRRLGHVQNPQNQNLKKGDLGGGSLRSLLQAHSSMRKCLCLDESMSSPLTCSLASAALLKTFLYIKGSQKSRLWHFRASRQNQGRPARPNARRAAMLDRHQLGMIGLGRMGAKVRRLIRDTVSA